MRAVLAAALLLAWPLGACGVAWVLSPAGSAAVSTASTLVSAGLTIGIVLLSAGAGWRLAHPAPRPAPRLIYTPLPLIEGTYEQTNAPH